MKFVALVVFFAFIAGSFAAEFAGFFHDPNHPGKCVYGNLILNPGEEGQPSGKCERFLCGRENGFGKVQSCYSQSAQPPCTLGDYVNPNGPYPECCKKKVICP